MNEEVQDYLADNGYPHHIVLGGLPGLLRRWDEFTREAERGYEYGLQDYRNDLDLRAIIRMAGAESEVAEADARLQALLTGCDVRVWESADGDPWWDFGYPANAGRWLWRDLVSAGLADEARSLCRGSDDAV